MPPEKPATWWQQFDFEIGQCMQWKIGPLTLAAQRLTDEWSVAYEEDLSILIGDEAHTWHYESSGLTFDNLKLKENRRFAMPNHPGDLYLNPLLADRPIITRPITPLSVPPDEITSIFVTTPLWLKLEAGPKKHTLLEIPLRRPSDTWFGDNTISGELCYASRTHGRLHFENITTPASRAITQIHIQNQGHDALLVERFSLPVLYLSLFGADDGTLWTESVTMVRSKEQTMASFQRTEAPPPQAIGAKRVSSARKTHNQNMVIRAFEAIFG